jgi:foldase protein PrsA
VRPPWPVVPWARVGPTGLLGYAAPAVKIRAFLAAVSLAGLGAAAGGCQAGSPYAAIVNGTRISQADLLRELHAIGDNRAFVTAYDQNASQAAASGQGSGATIFSTDTATPTFTQAFTAVVLNSDILAAVIHDQVVRLHAEPTPAQVAAARNDAAQGFGSPALFGRFNGWFQHVFEVRAAERSALDRVLPPVDSSEAGIEKFYRDNPQDFIASECVSHILVPSRDAAASIRVKIAKGASFASMARAYSTDKASAAKGGDLGCNPPGQYVQAFEQAADTATVGKVTQPVYDSQFNGWHLILVTRRDVTPIDDTIRGEIRQHLQSESPSSAFFEQAQKTLSVHVNPAYGMWDPSSGVVPPTGPGPTGGAPTTTGPAPAAGPGAPAPGGSSTGTP